MARRDWGLIVAVSVVFAPAVIAMAKVWASVDYYSHGFLVPVFAAAAFQPIARRLGPTTADPRGYAVLLAALVLYALGLALGGVSLQGLSVVAAVAGLTLRLWGPAGLRQLAFPIAFLLFMVPLPQDLLQPVIVQLQVLVSAASVDLLHELGYSVLREGNVLVLPSGERLFVAEACSGITSIVTLAPLGVALAYFTEPRWSMRLLIVAAVVPLAMLGNLVRVVATVAVAEAYGLERATQTTLHDLAGLLTFAVVCLALVAFAALLHVVGRPAIAET